jgi:hypothetical protein
MATEQMNARYMRVNGVIYFRAEDVAAYVRSLGSTEETDVRNRLNEAANALYGAREGRSR